MAEQFKPSTAQEFVGENKELPTRDELLSMFTEKQKDLANKLAESEARPGFKLNANEMMAKKRTERDLKAQIEALNQEWVRFGGDKIDEAQAAVEALNFKSDANDHIQAKYALRDATEAFYSNFTESFNASNEDDDIEEPIALPAPASTPIELPSPQRDSEPDETNDDSIIDNDTDTETADADTGENQYAKERKILGELTAKEIAEYKAKKEDADFQRRIASMPYNMADSETDWNLYEAGHTAMKDELTDAEAYKARNLADNGDIKAAQKIYNELLRKARKSVESGRYNENDYREAANALFEEIFGIGIADDGANQNVFTATTPAEIIERVNAYEGQDNKSNTVTTPAEIRKRLDDYKSQAVKPSDEHQAAFDQAEASNPDGLIDRLNEYDSKAVKPTKQHEKAFKEAEKALEAEKKPSRLKRILGKFGLRSSGIKRPSLLNRYYRQDQDYRDWRRQVNDQKKERLDQKLDRLDSKAEARQGRRAAKLEADEEVEVVDEADEQDDKPAERSGRVHYESERENIEHMIERAKRHYDNNENDKAKALYRAARERLAGLEPLGENEAFNDIFTDEFYAKLNKFGKNFEEESN